MVVHSCCNLEKPGNLVFFELKKAFVVGETAYIAVGGCRKDLKIRFREDAYEANWVSKKYKYP